MEKELPAAVNNSDVSLHQEAPKKYFIRSKSFLLLSILILITLSAIFIKTYQNINKSQPHIVKKTIIKQELVRRSQIPNIIIRAMTAKAIDVKTGKVVTAARVFSTDDKTIYLALDLNNPAVGTRIDYIRYLNGRYIDHGSVKVALANTDHLNFKWTVSRLISSLIDGKYKVATYSNGVLDRRITYVVEKKKVAQVFEENVRSTDADYRLALIYAL